MSESGTPAAGNHDDANAATRLLLDAFERVHESVPDAVLGIGLQELTWRPDADANPLGWLVWHLSRVQDNHLSQLEDSAEVWVAQGWAGRFALPYPDSAIGYGHTSQEVGSFTIDDPSLLVGYHDAVHEMTVELLSNLAREDFDRVVDESFDPPVTLGTRLVSVINDTTQHIGQAAYVRGLIDRR